MKKYTLQEFAIARLKLKSPKSCRQLLNIAGLSGSYGFGRTRLTQSRMLSVGVNISSSKIAMPIKGFIVDPGLYNPLMTLLNRGRDLFLNNPSNSFSERPSIKLLLSKLGKLVRAIISPVL